MGMYDSVIFKCPKCGEHMEAQSKVGDCALWEYELSKVPATIAVDIDGDEIACLKCGQLVLITMPGSLPAEVPMDVTAKRE